LSTVQTRLTHTPHENKSREYGIVWKHEQNGHGLENSKEEDPASRPGQTDNNILLTCKAGTRIMGQTTHAMEQNARTGPKVTCRQCVAQFMPENGYQNSQHGSDNERPLLNASHE
jgi:hypothetical protein